MTTGIGGSEQHRDRRATRPDVYRRCLLVEWKPQPAPGPRLRLPFPHFIRPEAWHWHHWLPCGTACSVAQGLLCTSSLWARHRTSACLLWPGAPGACVSEHAFSCWALVLCLHTCAAFCFLAAGIAWVRDGLISLGLKLTSQYLINHKMCRGPGSLPYRDFRYLHLRQRSQTAKLYREGPPMVRK